MGFFHGNRVTRLAQSEARTVEVGSGITFVVGTAPVHTVGGAVNEVVKASGYSEAVAALGYSDDWDSYTLCEVIDCHLQRYQVGPVLFVNVLDPEKHRTSVTAQDYALVNGQAKLPLEAILDTIVVTGADRGVDYDVFYDDGACVLEIIDGGALSGTTVEVTYSAVDPSKVTEADVIGGQDAVTGARSGFELIAGCIPKYRMAPDIIICPKYSKTEKVAAIMDAKTTISGILYATALADLPALAGASYIQVSDLKAAAVTGTGDTVLCWPKVSYKGRTYHLSTQLAALMGQVDAESGGYPSESPSNHNLKADSAVLDDGSGVLLELEEVNYINAQGVVTAFNFVNGWVVWGNYAACYPERTVPQYAFISVNRMMKWLANSMILTFWSRIDGRLTKRYLDALVDEANVALNGLVSAGHLLGGRVEALDSENPKEDLAAGVVRPHIYATPPSPAQEIDWQLEYDLDYASALFE